VRCCGGAAMARCLGCSKGQGKDGSVWAVSWRCARCSWRRKREMGSIGGSFRVRQYPRYFSGEDDGDHAAAGVRVCLGCRGQGGDARRRRRDAGGGRRRSSARRTGALQSVVITLAGMYWACWARPGLANASLSRAPAGHRDDQQCKGILQDKVVQRGEDQRERKHGGRHCHGMPLV
jgi:hypothetical protein